MQQGPFQNVFVRLRRVALLRMKMYVRCLPCVLSPHGLSVGIECIFSESDIFNAGLTVQRPVLVKKTLGERSDISDRRQPVFSYLLRVLDA